MCHVMFQFWHVIGYIVGDRSSQDWAIKRNSGDQYCKIDLLHIRILYCMVKILYICTLTQN